MSIALSGRFDDIMSAAKNWYEPLVNEAAEYAISIQEAIKCE